MKQYLYLFLITTLINIIFQSYLEFFVYPNNSYKTISNSFYAVITLSSILYLISFSLMFSIHFLLKKFIKTLDFYCYLISVTIGFLFIFLFFTIYLKHNIIDTFVNNRFFIIFYSVAFIFLLLKYFKYRSLI